MTLAQCHKALAVGRIAFSLKHNCDASVIPVKLTGNQQQERQQPFFARSLSSIDKGPFIKSISLSRPGKAVRFFA